MTEELKRIADAIVRFLKEEQELNTKQLIINRVSNKENVSDRKVSYVISLLVDKGIISKTEGYQASSLNYVSAKYYLSDKGWLYESYDKLLEDEATQLEKENNQISSSILSNKSNTINAIATFIFGVVVTTATVMTCRREIKRDNREEQKLIRDSIEQLQRAKLESEADKKISTLQQTIDSVKAAIDTIK